MELVKLNFFLNTYIKPEKNSGTNFYKSKSGREKRKIEWKTNRGVFFSRKERSTWHSYEGDGISNRVVLVYNLMTNRIKEVYKIEDKSYFFGQLRHKINPHLYRFFKNSHNTISFVMSYSYIFI